MAVLVLLVQTNLSADEWWGGVKSKLAWSSNLASRKVSIVAASVVEILKVKFKEINLLFAGNPKTKRCWNPSPSSTTWLSDVLMPWWSIKSVGLCSFHLLEFSFDTKDINFADEVVLGCFYEFYEYRRIFCRSNLSSVHSQSSSWSVSSKSWITGQDQRLN